jgi:uncharacterized membrane protein YfcA
MLFVLGVGLAAGTLSGIVGFGSSIMLMPVLVIVFGPLHAVPIMAIAAILANLSRVLIWWREVDWRAVAAYAVTGVPAAALGARGFRLRLPHLLALGAVIGFLTGIVVTTGPITAPIFLAYGLVKGAFIATEAASSLAVYLSKSAVFRRFGALPLPVITQGLITGASLMAGAWIAKRFVLRLHPDRFRLVMDALMLLSGATMLWTAFR